MKYTVVTCKWNKFFGFYRLHTHNFRDRDKAVKYVAKLKKSFVWKYEVDGVEVPVL